MKTNILYIISIFPYSITHASSAVEKAIQSTTETTMSPSSDSPMIAIPLSSPVSTQSATTSPESYLGYIIFLAIIGFGILLFYLWKKKRNQ